jgi:ABC-type multidrug transport system fused ATPase/permease subunit
MMGMKDSPYWLSWLLYHTIINTCITIPVWLFSAYGVFSFSSSALILVHIWLYGQSLFGFIVLMQAFFSSARGGAVAIVVIYFGTSISFVSGGDEGGSFGGNFAFSFFPTTCMGNVIKTIVGFEQNELAVNFMNSHRWYKNFSVLFGLIMLAVDFLWMTLMGLWLEHVLPKTFGTRLSCCFCFQSGCCKRDRINKVNINEDPKRQDSFGSQNRKQSDQFIQNLLLKNFEFETAHMNRDCYENVTPEVAMLEATKRFMKVKDLRKQYDNGFLAVKKINLKLFADQIFVLLGHNGAGKSSTISLLTGLYAPTKGEAEIFGIDMFNDQEDLREIMGICPQHDVLFELLSPKEHLEIFYDFKNGDPDPEKKAAEI